MRSMAKRELELRSAALVVKTRNVLDALRDERREEEVDLLVDQQREAFNDFSRVCDPNCPLDPATRANVDLVIELEREVGVAIEAQHSVLVAQGRAIANQRDVARAFHSNPPEPPQFITRRV